MREIIIIVLMLVFLSVLIHVCPNDQPVRIVAVLVFAPYIFWKGLTYDDPYLMAFGAGLFGWDLYCILFKKPAV